MSYSFHLEISRIWQKAVNLYKNGHKEPQNFPIEDELSLLADYGMTKMDVFDYVEDWCLHQEPDLITFILVHYERWNFFWEEQKGVLSTNRLNPKDLPGKNEELGGIVWLPRILPKAKAKLCGELPSEVMYGCGGDRQFFQINNVHPAEFLRVIRRMKDNTQGITDWVVERKSFTT